MEHLDQTPSLNDYRIKVPSVTDCPANRHPLQTLSPVAKALLLSPVATWLLLRENGSLVPGR